MIPSAGQPSYIDHCDRWLAGLSEGMIKAAMLFLCIMTVLIGIQVTGRNLFNMGLPWADEIARFTGLGTVFFTIPLLQYQGRHIAVDIFSSRIRGRAAIILKVINEIIVLVFCLLLLISFANFFQCAAFFSTPATGMPNWFFYSPALAGIVVCTLVTGLRLLRIIFSGNTRNSSSDIKDGPEL